MGWRVKSAFKKKTVVFFPLADSGSLEKPWSLRKSWTGKPLKFLSFQTFAKEQNKMWNNTDSAMPARDSSASASSYQPLSPFALSAGLGLYMALRRRHLLTSLV
jgi:hypothetical protein